MWQPNNRQWCVLVITALFIACAWPPSPPSSDKSLAMKFVNWAVDPRGELPVMPPPFTFANGDDPETVTAHELLRYGSVLKVVEREKLRDTALEVARAIADKSPTVIRAAKESLNGIDPVDVKRSYRFEQGFTFELNLAGEGDKARGEFVRKSED